MPPLPLLPPAPALRAPPPAGTRPHARRCARRAAAALAALGAAALPAPAGAQLRTTVVAPDGVPYLQTIVNIEDGLGDTRVSAIAQTPDGYLWFGTRRGLARYDGLSFSFFSPDSIPALPSGSVNALRAEPDGRLWISTARGLAVLERGTFRRIAADQVPAAVTWQVVRDRRGRLWVGGAFGLRVGDGTHFTPVPGATAFIYTVTEDAAGRIWFAGRDYLASIAPGDSVPVVAPFSANQRFFDLVAGGGDTLWVATRGGVWRLDTARPAAPVIAERAATGAVETELSQVWAMTRAPDGTFWLGTQGRGVLRWAGDTPGRLAPSGSGVPDETWALLADRRGRIWAGTSGGLLLIERTPFGIPTEGMQGRSTWSVRADRAGRLWAATADGQVYEWQGQRWTSRVPRARRAYSSVMWPRREGGMWVLHDARRLLAVDGARQVDMTASLGLPDRGLQGVLEEPDGTLWFSTEAGVLRAREGRLTPMNRLLGLADATSPRVIARDARGRLLFGGPNLTVLEGGAAHAVGAREGLTDSVVRALWTDRENVWIGTADSGLFVLRRGRVTALSRFEPRLRRDVVGILEDDAGWLWLTSRFGLVRVSRRDLERAADGQRTTIALRTFDRADGLPTTEFNGDYQSQLYRDPQGTIWLPSYGGPVRLDPRAIALDTVPPQAHIERVVVDGRPLAPLDGAVRLDGHPTRVEVTFAATDANVAQRVRAEYRIEGVDDGWQPAGRRRVIAFGPLAGGRYRVEVRVAAEDGGWNPRTATLALDVPRAPWERRWFYPLLLLLAGAATAGAFRVRLRIAEGRERQLAALVEARTAELEAERASLEGRVAERTADLSRELAERTRLEQRLLTAQKMESLGRLAGGVAHEINNSITGVLGFTELAQLSAEDRPELQADLQEVWRAGRRVADITQQLLAFARRQHTQPTAVSLGILLRGLQRALEQLAGERVALTFDLPDGIPSILADPSQVEQLLFNLVKNARDAMPDGGRVTISVRTATLPAVRPVGDAMLAAGLYVTLAVRDTGHGMPSETLARLFEPFFTTKGVNRGTGLGLAVCHGIVARHHGAIEVTSAVGVGTTFTIWLPTWTGIAPAVSAASPTPTGHETILLVEDEAAVRLAATRMLTHLGYRVREAADAEAALALMDDGAADVDILVTDVLMPGLTGAELAQRLRAQRPGLPVVFMSGFAGLDPAAMAEFEATGPMVAKPFSQEDLARTVRRELDRRPARPAGGRGD